MSYWKVPRPFVLPGFQPRFPVPVLTWPKAPVLPVTPRAAELSLTSLLGPCLSPGWLPRGFGAMRSPQRLYPGLRVTERLESRVTQFVTAGESLSWPGAHKRTQEQLSSRNRG